jgi:hypothetical protein
MGSGCTIDPLWQPNSFLAILAELNSRLKSNSSYPRSSLYSLGAAPTENTASSIVACCFTAAEMCLPHSCVATRAARIHRKRRLQHLSYCCVTSQRTWRVPLLRVYGPLPSNDCFSAAIVLSLSKYATILWHVDMLLGNDREISDCIRAVAK